MLKSISRIFILFIISISTIFLTCSKSSTEPKDEIPSGTKVIASTGGVLTSSDGLLTMTIPPNALDDDTYIDIKVVNEGDYPDALDTIEVVGKVYGIQPDGTVFNTPAKLEFQMTEDEINSIENDSSYTILTGLSISSNGVLTAMDSSKLSIDLQTNNGLFSGYISHLSSQTKTEYLKSDDDDDTWPKGSVTVKVDFGNTDCPTEPQNIVITVENNSSISVKGDAQVWGTDGLTESAYPPDIEPTKKVQFIAKIFSCSKPGVENLKVIVWIHYGNNWLCVIKFKQAYNCCDKDGDGVTDDNDNCPDDANPDQDDADSDGIGDVCETTDSAFCDDVLFDVAGRSLEFFFGASACNSSTDNVYTGPTQQTPTDGPTKNRSMDEVTTFAQGGSRLMPDVYQRTTWDNSFPPDGQPNLPGDLVGSDDWQAWSLNPAGVQKQNRFSQSLDENPLIFINVMYANIPMNDPTYFYQFGFVFDRDGITTNNYQPSSQFENDFFKDTDYWIDIQYSPSTGWVMWVTDVANGAFEQVASEAQLIVINNTMFLVIPRSEFLAQNIGYRMTAYRHTGDWGLSGGVWDGDVQPPVADGLIWLDIGQ